LALRLRIEDFAARISWTIGMFDGQANEQAPHSMQSIT
jgi:hypothetical protein